MEKATGYLDINNRIHKSEHDAGLYSLAAMIGSDNEYINLDGANALIKSLGENPEVFAWLTSKFTMAEYQEVLGSNRKYQRPLEVQQLLETEQISHSLMCNSPERLSVVCENYVVDIT